jgi:uncharacterized protein YqgV (UPF0045/DUF77 family)
MTTTHHLKLNPKTIKREVKHKVDQAVKKFKTSKVKRRLHTMANQLSRAGHKGMKAVKKAVGK